MQGSSTRGRRNWWEPRYGAYKRGLNSKIHLAVDAHGMPIRVIVTAGTEVDCAQAIPLINGIIAELLLGDKGYDTNEIIEFALQSKMQIVIPPKKNRKKQRPFDEYIYKMRHLVENAFLKLKRWRGVATRYAKTTIAFVGAVIACCILQWLRVRS